MAASFTWRRFFVAALVTCFLSALVILSASPLLWPDSMLARWTPSAFTSVCHQMESRSFSLGGATMCVCTRCFGIYLGLAVGAWFALFSRTLRARIPVSSLYWWLIVSVPIAVQWFVGAVSSSMDDPILRMLTGIIFGLFGGAALITVVRADPHMTAREL